ncbi:hypothetical protein V5799_013844 [Amblyomma americanum]|uniref:Peptidase M13 N-terminal domain-containing protein n=1 Tax=Amblyomma americanum TaxID=6943 RepID=A0AAQ4E4R1_AMBAM
MLCHYSQATTLKTETAERAQPHSQPLTGVLKSTRYRALWLVALAATLVVALALFLAMGFRLDGADKRVCSSAACEQLTASFEGVLNYSVDPCVDLDAFVCSKGLRGSSAERGSRSFVAHQIKEYELDMVQIFINDKSAFTASK